MNKVCEEEIQLYITRRVGLTIISAHNAFSFTSRYTPPEKVADNVLFPRSATVDEFLAVYVRSEKSSGSPLTNEGLRTRVA